MADLHFKVASRRTKPITFTLDGEDHEYSFTPPKQADMVLPMLEADDDIEAARAAFAWLDDGLSEEDRERISKRLKDKKDDLDIPQVQDMVNGLSEYVANLPTT
jgi:hypothetical protein